MRFSFPQPRYMPCFDCGASVARDEIDAHVCEHERLLDYRVFQHREALDAFEAELGTYLETPHGRFELWYARRRRAE